MRTVRRKQLVGEIVRLKDSFRIYGENGLYYVTECQQKAFEIANDLLTGISIKGKLE